MSPGPRSSRPRRRPVPPDAGAVVGPGARALAALVAGLTLAGCSAGPVRVTSPASGADLGACAELVSALPDRVDDQSRRDVEPDGVAGAAWGDPATVLTCGVPRPAGFDAVAICQIVDGVAWFIPDEQITGSPVDVTLTTIGRSVDVEVRVPAERFPPAGTMVDLAPALKRATERVERCA